VEHVPPGQHGAADRGLAQGVAGAVAIGDVQQWRTHRAGLVPGGCDPRKILGQLGGLLVQLHGPVVGRQRPSMGGQLPLHDLGEMLQATPANDPAGG
jgi:hypothetical protein